jgi:hypothetical protein
MAQRGTALCPLEDTAYEVKCIAQSLPKSKIRIRDEAELALGNLRVLVVSFTEPASSPFAHHQERRPD